MVKIVQFPNLSTHIMSGMVIDNFQQKHISLMRLDIHGEVAFHCIFLHHLNVLSCLLDH